MDRRMQAKSFRTTLAFLLALSGGAAIQIVRPTLALACSHNTEQGIFVKDARTNAYGAANTMTVVNRDLLQRL
jgi:hypothetical protein